MTMWKIGYFLLVIQSYNVLSFEYTRTTAFAAGSQVKECPPATSMNKPREKDYHTHSPEAIFETDSTRIDSKDDARSIQLNQHHNTIPVECNVTDLSNVDNGIQYDTNFVANTYELTNFEIIGEQVVREPKRLISKALALYLHLLQSSAILTKCLTAGFIRGVGDIFAQLFEHRISQRAKFMLDKRRVSGLMFESTLISGPLMHHAYDFLERMVPIHDAESEKVDSIDEDMMFQRKRWAAAIFHVLADTILLGPIYVLSIIVTSSVFEGRMNTLRWELATKFIPTLKASVYSSLGFMPMQVLAFRVLPIQFRLLYMNIQDIVWNAVVSFTAH